MCFGVALVCPASVCTWLTWALDEATAPIEKQIRSTAVHSKLDRAAGPLFEDALTLVLGDVEKGEVLGAELADDEVGEIADLRRNSVRKGFHVAGGAVSELFCAPPLIGGLCFFAPPL